MLRGLGSEGPKISAVLSSGRFLWLHQMHRGSTLGQSEEVRNHSGKGVQGCTWEKAAAGRGTNRSELWEPATMPHRPLNKPINPWETQAKTDSLGIRIALPTNNPIFKISWLKSYLLMMCYLFYFAQKIFNKDLLYSKGNSTYYSVITYMGRKSKKE